MRNESRDEEWTEFERKAIAALSRERAPNPQVEEALVAALREKGLVRRSSLRPLLLAAAAATLVFAGGWWLGTRSVREVPQQAKWMLLLHDAGKNGAPSPDEMLQRIQEYKEWAHAAVGHGLIDGDKLAADGVLLSSTPTGIQSRALPADGDILGGYFLLGDVDEAAALKLAQSCPQIHHGGVLELRRIDL